MLQLLLSATIAIVLEPELPLVPYPNEVVRAPGSCSTSAVIRTVSDPKIAAEGYRLTIAPTGIEIRSRDEAGLFYAQKTLKQLEAAGTGVYPCVTIDDAPRFSWRGMHLDVSRHFFGVDVVKRLIDRMASLKLNVFHWHLVDDQGWRLPIRAYPRLNTVGATRPRPDYMRWILDPEVGGQYGPYGYTVEEIREVVAYAKARHVRIVPEIEIPGHSREVMMAYPELFCGSYTDWLDATGFTNDAKRPDAMHDTVTCLGNEKTIRFFETVLDEVCELFPDSEVIHIGGDECPRKNWEKCPKCQAKMKALGLMTADELQSWCAKHFVDYLAKKDRRAIGWTEIMKGGVPKGAYIMSWLGAKGGLQAVTNGNYVVMVPHTLCYLDYQQGIDDADKVIYPRWATGRTLDLKTVYSHDPCAELPEEGKKFVLGAQTCNWTECTFDEKALEWKIFPRAFASAELLWTRQEKRDFARFEKRAATLRETFLKAGVNAAPLK